MKARITLLGSGTAVPTLKRNSPGLVVKVEFGDLSQNVQILIDPSAGSSQRLVRQGYPVEDLTHVLITHFHPDHTGDLVPLFFALKNPRFEKVGRSAPLQIHGPPGLNQLIKGLRGVYGHWIDLGDRVAIIERQAPGGELYFSNPLFKITAVQVEHSENSCAYRFQFPSGKIFVYSGDTDYCQGIIDASQNADLLFLECAFPEGEKKSGHLTPSEAGKVANTANVSKLVLTHLYPECEGKDLISPCREHYSGSVIVGEDGLSFDL